ncbi:hypothetical protein, partial [Prescottella equi]|uniref:hypothetical protein n=1 Tax=Rhodococcus hoagii TaxID=43767 RepID=UPI001642F337
MVVGEEGGGWELGRGVDVRMGEVGKKWVVEGKGVEGEVEGGIREGIGMAVMQMVGLEEEGNTKWGGKVEEGGVEVVELGRGMVEVVEWFPGTALSSMDAAGLLARMSGVFTIGLR